MPDNLQEIICHYSDDGHFIIQPTEGVDSTRYDTSYIHDAHLDF